MAKFAVITQEEQSLPDPQQVLLGEHETIGMASMEAKKRGLLPGQIHEVNASPLHGGGARVERALYM